MLKHILYTLDILLFFLVFLDRGCTYDVEQSCSRRVQATKVRYYFYRRGHFPSGVLTLSTCIVFVKSVSPFKFKGINVFLCSYV